MTASILTFECLNKPVFFYGIEKSFSHLIICLAEGLKELGIPLYSNINYWQIHPERSEYIFNHNIKVTPDDCSAVVVDAKWRFYHPSFPENLFHPERKYITVYLDDMDGPTIWNPELDNFDFRLRTHYNSQSQYPANCRPWVFGISNRILRETNNLPKFEERRKHITVNFRVSHQTLTYSKCFLKVAQGLLKVDNALIVIKYPLREIIREQFWPLIQEIMSVDDRVDDFDNPPSDSYHYLQWLQTGKRHYPNYYKRLKESIACACFGGYVTPSYATGESLVEWWDSWRFWESLAAGCVTFHVDFQKYGIQLPVMPENWRHYIGINLDNIQDTVDRIAGDPGVLASISSSGRQWAIDNYGPVPTALRFLETLGFTTSPVEKYLETEKSTTLSDPIELREINLIIFPDWSQPEESLSLDLERAIGAMATHQNKNKIALLVDTTGISDEDADLALSSAVMNLLMAEDLDVSDGPEIIPIGHLSDIQWQALLPRLHARIVLENENKIPIALAESGNLPFYPLDSFIQNNY
ncbi:MAG: hypothetical protein MUE44_10030 [Oscillatoriaceae cyanobacterium Prado104]|nr:hypothetical protein [Oscillatoriaceae cyanobacterium Prado104]